MNKFGYLGMYLLGALTGSVAVFFALNKKYKKMAEDEINEIRHLYKEQKKKFANREKFKNFKRRTKIITHKLLFAQYFT